MTPGINFVVSPQDAEKLQQSLQALNGPVGAVGWLAGFGTSEQRAGIPTWAWIAVAFGAGVATGLYSGRIRNRVKMLW